MDAWAEEVSRLGAQDGIGHVQVFENKGAMMGTSNPHPHCQIWATEHLPTAAQRRVATQRRYLLENGRDLLGDYLSRERVEGARIVCANDHWAVLVPFWAVWPFETLVIPARTVGHLSGLFGDERDALADILGRLNRRYDNLFGVSFPYSMSWHGQPYDGQVHPYWRLHASYFPAPAALGHRAQVRGRLRAGRGSAAGLHARRCGGPAPRGVGSAVGAAGRGRRRAGAQGLTA